MDLFRCESIVLRSYWVLVGMDQFTRRLVGVAVHCGPVNGADVCRMLSVAIHGRGTPRHLSTDHDPLFEGISLRRREVPVAQHFHSNRSGSPAQLEQRGCGWRNYG